MSEKVDLNQLRERLAKLGVHIDEPAAVKSPKRGRSSVVREQHALRSSWEAHLDRSSKEVAQLLERCNKVHQALHKDETDIGAEQQPAKPNSARAATSKTAAAVAAAAAAVRASKTAAASAGKPKLGVDRQLTTVSGRNISSATNAAAANTAAAAAKSSPSKDSQLLVRAAQRLLRDAQAEAHQVERVITAAATAPQQTAKPSSASAERSTPLATVLAQYKEAQAAWAQEKAKLRREAVANRKKASKLELELAKLQRLHQHKTLDVSSLRAALKGRDLQLEESQSRIKQLEEALAKSQEVAAEKLCSLSAERDDLQALLLATLQKLEGVEAVVAAADATSAAMEDKVRVFEEERQAALELVSASQAEITKLQEEQRRLQWQSQLLEKMSEVQLRHNKRKSSAIKELLSTTAAAPGAACSKHNGSSRIGARHIRQPGDPSAALQGLLDELLANDGEDDEFNAAAACNDDCGDDSTVLS